MKNFIPIPFTNVELKDNFWSESNQQKLKEQSKEINKLYSWETRKLEWINFLEKLK